MSGLVVFCVYLVAISFLAALAAALGDAIGWWLERRDR